MAESAGDGTKRKSEAKLSGASVYSTAVLGGSPPKNVKFPPKFFTCESFAKIVDSFCK